MSCFGLSHLLGLEEVEGEGRREKWDLNFYWSLESGAQDLAFGWLGFKFWSIT